MKALAQRKGIHSYRRLRKALNVKQAFLREKDRKLKRWGPSATTADLWQRR
jgi:hypothetical protein